MKLKQIALAAAVVAASSAALADVTVYGIADVNLNNSKAEVGSKPLSAFAAKINTPLQAGAASSVVKKLVDDFSKGGPSASDQAGQGRLGSSGLSTSRIGFKGTEDLGGGMQASFQLEGKINVDTGENANYDRPAASNANYFFGRQSWGLSGNFGKLQLGKTWTSFDDVAGSFNHADNTNVSVTSTVWNAFDGNYDNNTANQIKYTLPLSGGLTASLRYAFGENKTATQKANNVISLGVKYESGPLAVGYGYQNEDTFSDGASVKDRFHLIGGSFDLGSAKLVGSWSDAKSSGAGLRIPTGDAAAVAIAVNTAFGTKLAASDFANLDGETKATRYQLGVPFPMGASNLYFGYADSDEKSGGVKIGEANGYVLAATYSLSKRTTAYAGYTTVKAKLSALNISGKTSQTVAGIRHVF